MTFSWLQGIISIVSVVFGVVSIFLTISNMLTASHEAHRMSRMVQDQALTNAFASSDLVTVGKLLKNSLEQVSVFQYVNSPIVANRADKFLKHLADQVSLDPPLQASADGAPPRAAAPPQDDLREAYREVLSGEVWNGLARLRRLLEMQLRAIASHHDVAWLATRSVGTVVTFLQRGEIIPHDIVKTLREILSICNRAVHGLELSVGEAEHAVRLAAKVVPQLERAASADKGL